MPYREAYPDGRVTKAMVDGPVLSVPTVKGSQPVRGASEPTGGACAWRTGRWLDRLSFGSPEEIFPRGSTAPR